MNGPYPTPEEHSDATGRSLEVQTDKPLWKIVPCTYEGCEVDLVVTTFYAPHKAKCNRHSSKSPKAIATSKLIAGMGSPAVEPNGSLANLLCPLCKMPLRLIRVDESMGNMVFACTDGRLVGMKELRERAAAGLNTNFCGTSLEIRPNWKAMEMREIPTRFREFAAELNIQQDLAYFDERDKRDDAQRT